MRRKTIVSRITLTLFTEHMAPKNESDCYPSSGINVEVLRFGVNPLTYTIFPSFKGAEDILSELLMPTGKERAYSLSFVSVRNFLRYSGRYHHKIAKRFSRYTVEAFGLRIKLPTDFDLGMTVPLPDPSQYKCQPDYWIPGGIIPVQIWRLRVISCPLEDLKTSPSSPFGKLPIGTMYVEERWHPQEDKQKSTHLIGKASLAQIKRLERFEKDAMRILGGTFKLGRPRGTKKYTLDEFRDKLRAAYKILCDGENKQQPKQFALAENIGISLATFKRFMDDIGNPKPPY